MAIENIAYVTESGALLGVASREDIHKRGLWHETLHCWVVTRELGRYMIHLQLRSSEKADFPRLFDITAAGHIAADESVEDGVREIEEELGLPLKLAELVPLGVIHDEISLPGFTDRERAHVYLYKGAQLALADYRLQREEVAGMAAAEFQAFFELCTKQVEHIHVSGFHETPNGREPFRKTVGLSEMVPHEAAYWEQVAIRIRKELMA
ncbi:NUDIX domain-containing protein [Planococcus sp. ISL-109]|uniref:NUDIX hydrolase n=1 Tax=Planococcus sp. ISL-109 TaxID=2819166 RepID=UPI001BE6577A|nr:NUDIX domain-containing protein [Planococcus sp. ISL-109]MBT2581524.1 NUDIX domain-containing protein [Planococcus sp. ISL-109]